MLVLYCSVFYLLLDLYNSYDLKYDFKYEKDATRTHLCEDVDAVSGVGVEGVFLRKLSKKFIPLDIMLEKLRFRLRPKRGLQVGVRIGEQQYQRHL